MMVRPITMVDEESVGFLTVYANKRKAKRDFPKSEVMELLAPVAGPDRGQAMIRRFVSCFSRCVEMPGPWPETPPEEPVKPKRHGSATNGPCERS